MTAGAAAGPVVYVDDEPSLCRIFALRMAALGVAVETFTDALAAVDYVNDHDVVCVLCDYRMPGLSGLEVLDRLEREVPFYLVTGDIAMEVDAGSLPGLYGVLRKPICYERVASLVEDGASARPAGGADRG